MASVIQRKGQHMTDIKEIAEIEGERVDRLFSEALDEIEESGGNVEVFTIILFETALRNLVEIRGEEIVADMVTRIGLHEMGRRGKKPS